MYANLGRSAFAIASGCPLLDDAVARWRGRRRRRIKRLSLVSLEVQNTLGNVLENQVGPDVNLLQSEA